MLEILMVKPFPIPLCWMITDRQLELSVHLNSTRKYALLMNGKPLSPKIFGMLVQSQVMIR